jgi:hypothetical protein
VGRHASERWVAMTRCAHSWRRPCGRSLPCGSRCACVCLR